MPTQTRLRHRFLSARTQFGTITMSSSKFEWTERNVIHVTGFGPFRQFEAGNPSWDAVSRLPDFIEHNDRKLTIEKHKVPVTYEAVDEIVPKLWKTKPLVSRCCDHKLKTFKRYTSASIQLVVHCGVNHQIKKIYLEKNALNGNFCQADWDGKHLEEVNLCLPNSGACKQLCTKLDLDSIVDTCADKRLGCSTDPGK